MGQVYWLGELQSIQVSRVGDVVLWLERLCQKGYAVPPTWILPATVFEQTLLESNLSNLDTSIYPGMGEALNLLADGDRSQLLDRYEDLQVIARSLQEMIVRLEIPTSYLVDIEIALSRVPTTQLRLQPSFVKRDSLKYVQGASGLWEPLFVAPQLSHVMSAIRHLWVNTFSAQSLFYWLSQNCVPQHIQFAVIAQAIGTVVCAGFLQITSHTLQVEAVWGLSAAIARGEAIPARYEKTWGGKVMTQTAGQQTLAYSSESANFGIDPQAQPAPLTSSLMPNAYWISAELQSRSPLSPNLLKALEELGEQLWKDFQTPAVIEWVYELTESGAAQIHVIGFEPILSIAQDAEPVQRLTPQTPSTTHAENTIADPALIASAITPKILRGLAASPGHATGKAWVVPATETLPDLIPANSILITTSLSPTWLPILRQVKGVITEQGGLTSHSAILARELGIPAVLGVAAAMQHLAANPWVLLDGDRGEISYGTDLSDPTHPHPSNLPLASAWYPLPITPAPTSRLDEDTGEGTPNVTKLFVNLSQLESLDRTQIRMVDGVGLLRAEFMVLDILDNQHPLAWLEQGRANDLTNLLARKISQFTQVFQPQPVFYRFLDLQGHELQSLKGHNVMGHPVLGLRGALSYQYFPDLFRVELAAIAQVQAAGYNNLNVLIPFVRSVAEFQFCYEQIRSAGLLLSGQMQVWMMAEVPSVIFQLAEYQQAGVQGVSIGTNDLTQLLLGVDRDHPLFGGLDERHPAVQQAIASLIRQSRELNLPCSICGDAPALYPELIDSLVEFGITGISVNPNVVESTHRAIMRAERRLLLQAARQSP